MEESVEPSLGSLEGTNDSTLLSNANGLHCRPVVSCREEGEGLPYAPVDWPSPGDKWAWRVGRKKTRSGYWIKRYLYPPMRLQKSMGTFSKSFDKKTEIRAYLAKEFPDADIDAFFSSFQWKIPCVDHAAIEAAREQKRKRARSLDPSYDNSKDRCVETRDESSILATKSPVGFSQVVAAEDPLTARRLSFSIESHKMPSSSLPKQKGSERQELVEESEFNRVDKLTSLTPVSLLETDSAIDQIGFVQTTTTQDATGVIPESVKTDTPGNVITPTENRLLKCSADGKSSCTHTMSRGQAAGTETGVQIPVSSPDLFHVGTDHTLTIRLQRLAEGTQIPEAIQQGLTVAAGLVMKSLKSLPLEFLGDRMKYFNDHIEWFVKHNFPINELEQELNIRFSTFQVQENRRREIEMDLNKIEATLAQLEQELAELDRQANGLHHERQHLFAKFSF